MKVIDIVDSSLDEEVVSGDVDADAVANILGKRVIRFFSNVIRAPKVFTHREFFFFLQN